MNRIPPQPAEGARSPLSRRYTRLSEPVIAASGLAGIAGIASLPVTFALKRPVTLPVKIAACSSPVLLGSSLMLECFGRNRLVPLERGRGSTERRRAPSEVADLRILGVGAGLLIATRRNLSSLKGWQKWIGLSSIGAGLGEVGQSAFRHSEVLQYVQQFHENGEAIKSNLATYVKDLFEACRRGHLGGVLQTVPMGPPRHQEPPRTNADAFALTQADLEKQLIHGGKVTRVNTQDGPHVTATEPGETELKPAPHTNYDWMVPQQRVVPELEHHIAKVRAHRAKLSTEAQVIWEWLGEKEAQYYHIRDSDTAVGYDAEHNKKHLREYCKTLATEHLTLWMAVCKIDWIIADTMKRIAQHRQFSKGQYQVSSQSDPTQGSSSLSFALTRLQDRLDLVDIEMANQAKTMALLESDLHNPSLPNMPEPIRGSLRGASKKDRENIIRGLIEEGKRVRQDLVVHKAAVEEILGDAERRATPAVRDA